MISKSWVTWAFHASFCCERLLCNFKFISESTNVINWGVQNRSLRQQKFV